MSDLHKKRKQVRNISLRQAGKEMKISAATLCRVEQSGICDVTTFAKICTWLNTKPNRYFK